MQGCTAIKEDYHVCGRRTVDDIQGLPDHVHLCHIHLPIYTRNSQRAGHTEPGKCQKFLTTGRWCTHNALDGELICGMHLRLREQRALRNQQQTVRRQRINTMITIFFQANPRLTWREVARAMFNQQPEGVNDIRYAVALRYFGMAARERDVTRLARYWDWLDAGEPGVDPTLVVVVPPAPPPVPELGRIAADAQSVHTAPVSQQTNAGTEKLLAAAIPNNQQTEKSIMRGWLNMDRVHSIGWNDMLRVANDVNKWFNTPACRAQNDNLYRRLLRGLVATINRSDDEMRPELYKRLWEECREATGMCCEGHISRLCNVMVGFDEAFQPQVSLGELMQQKMAAIASLDASEEEKRRQATAWFDEMAVPAAERAAWLDAF